MLNTTAIFTNSRRILSCYYYNFLELLAVKTTFFHSLLLGWRKPVFINETKLAKVTSKDTVLLIGCGIFPSETMIIAEETGAHVTGIDNAPNVVKIARKYIKKKGLSDLVTITLGDGIECAVQDFTVIFIAINVFPINTVLTHLSKKVKKGTRILCKSIDHDIPTILRKESLDRSFTIVDSINNPKTQSYLLIKQ